MSSEKDVLVKLRNQLLELESKYRELANEAENWMIWWPARSFPSNMQEPK